MKPADVKRLESLNYRSADCCTTCRMSDTDRMFVMSKPVACCLVSDGYVSSTAVCDAYSRKQDVCFEHRGKRS